MKKSGGGQEWTLWRKKLGRNSYVGLVVFNVWRKTGYPTDGEKEKNWVDIMHKDLENIKKTWEEDKETATERKIWEAVLPDVMQARDGLMFLIVVISSSL